jgi:hypothetical protein
VTNEQILTSYDFKLVTRAEFDAATDVPPGIRDRARDLNGAFVLYDPIDDDLGFLLVGDDRKEMAREFVETNELKEGGP